MALVKVTESDSLYRHLEQKSIREILEDINNEDHKVPSAIASSLDQIEALATAIANKMKNGGRLFYIGAGTSGRLGVLDASECPPTYGVSKDWVIGIMAGGDYALRNSVEHAEDDPQQAWKDLQNFNVSNLDVVVGIAASGTTPYVVKGLKTCRENGISTGCIVCNPGSPVAAEADFPVEVIVGPEYVTGSTRMKSGTAQKLVLNMLSTSVMIQLGRVFDNKMVDMQLSNTKLVDRGVRQIVDKTGIPYDEAKILLEETGSVRAALLKKGKLS